MLNLKGMVDGDDYLWKVCVWNMVVEIDDVIEG